MAAVKKYNTYLFKWKWQMFPLLYIVWGVWIRITSGLWKTHGNSMCKTDMVYLWLDHKSTKQACKWPHVKRAYWGQKIDGTDRSWRLTTSSLTLVACSRTFNTYWIISGGATQSHPNHNAKGAGSTFTFRSEIMLDVQKRTSGMQDTWD